MVIIVVITVVIIVVITGRSAAQRSNLVQQHGLFRVIRVRFTLPWREQSVSTHVVCLFGDRTQL